MTARVKVLAGVAAVALGAAGFGVGLGVASGDDPVGAVSMRGSMSQPGMTEMGMGHMGSAGAMHDGGGHAMGSMQVESEFDYLTHMVPHHEEAIAAARELLARTDRPEMRTFAESIIRTQSAEVVEIRRFLQAWYPGRDVGVTYEPMMRDLSGLRGDELDRAFLEDMIPHHMHAVMMSQQLLVKDLPVHDEVAALAASIRDAQHAEIGTMAGWLAAWYGESPMGALGHGRMMARS